MSKKKLFFNYFKHVPDDLVITSTPGIIISAAGTILLLVLFVFQLKDYLAIGSETTLVVDELVDDTLRVNFNVTLHEANAAPELPPLSAPIRTLAPQHQCPAQARAPRSGAVRVPVGGRLRPDGHRAAQHQQGHPQMAAQQQPGGAGRLDGGGHQGGQGGGTRRPQPAAKAEAA